MLIFILYRSKNLLLFSDIDDSVNFVDRFRPCVTRARPQQFLVLGPGEAVSSVRRFQDCGKHPAPSVQPRHGLDGHVLLTRTTSY